MEPYENAAEMITTIRRALNERGMKATDLALAVGTTDATMSRFLNQKTKPRPQLLEAIVRELGLDMAHIFRLAGLPLPGRPGPLDPSAAYLAQRITELPPHLRDKALDAAGAVVDAFGELADEEVPDLFEGEDAKTVALFLETQRKDPVAYEMLQKWLQRERQDAPANHDEPENHIQGS